VLKRLRHSHIVRTYEFHETPCCLVLEHIAGHTLDYYARGEPDAIWQIGGWRTVALVGKQIASALSYASEQARQLSEELQTRHERPSRRSTADFAHRDIHPGNIMLTVEGEDPYAYLLDFGLARLQPAGTISTLLHYVDPMLIYRDLSYPDGGVHGDMFSLGVVLCEVLTGATPYDAEEYRQYRSDRKKSPLPILRRVEELSPNRGIPRALGDTIAKMVDVDPRQQFAKWEEVEDQFSQILQTASAAGASG
jgi:serine/threonine protein kinase